MIKYKQPPFSSTKILRGYPCAHRQWAHSGHCKLIHGYSRDFYFKFAAHALEEKTHFVLDFGSLKFLKSWLKLKFDHTCLVNQDDPEMDVFEDLYARGIIELVVLPNVGMEATAKYVADYLNSYLYHSTKGRVWCYEIEVRENEKNSGIWHGSRTHPEVPYVISEVTALKRLFPDSFVAVEQAFESGEYVTFVGTSKEGGVEFISYPDAVRAVAQGDYRNPLRLYQELDTWYVEPILVNLSSTYKK